ncbi:hypothetical protein PoB_005443700 [Plakobranchus ocellatus]|uniref:Uncharacterized protein n=1 Tax=Plakobranchus ocellatus TaxID=259542 RepID=A0AAV4C9I6_9GAST|nr:hypothetical protein PoB_005443700 [Plakobranchus ocellatus]
MFEIIETNPPDHSKSITRSPVGHGASGGVRTRQRRAPADITASSVSSGRPRPPEADAARIGVDCMMLMCSVICVIMMIASVELSFRISEKGHHRVRIYLPLTEVEIGPFKTDDEVGTP